MPSPFIKKILTKTTQFEKCHSHLQNKEEELHEFKDVIPIYKLKNRN